MAGARRFRRALANGVADGLAEEFQRQNQELLRALATCRRVRSVRLTSSRASMGDMTARVPHAQ